ncbi:hypothetical protein MMC07_003464 [Pseudocyphellaria aurata]|nr:hypothetical protein [Pseudocyphellaria aurata]
MSSLENSQPPSLPLSDGQQQYVVVSSSSGFPVSPFETKSSVPLSPSFPVCQNEQGLYQPTTFEEELHLNTIDLQRDLGLDLGPNQYGAPYHPASNFHNNPPELDFYPDLPCLVPNQHGPLTYPSVSNDLFSHPVETNIYPDPSYLGLNVDPYQYGAPTSYPVSNGPHNYSVQPNLYQNASLISTASRQNVERKKRTTTSTAAPSRRPAKAKKTSNRVSKPNQVRKSKPRYLEAPLSELTKAFEHIPIRDMSVLINQTSEARQAASVKRGCIPRPMNSYMLYRAAYQSRCKAWRAINNHQIVSELCGESWHYETPAIKTLYGKYAEIEKENHALAFPGYKYRPAKSR